MAAARAPHPGALRMTLALLLLTLGASGAEPARVPLARSTEDFVGKLRAECADAGACPGPPASPAVSVLVVGLDGVNWAVVDPLLEAGFLPTLRTVVEAGARAELDCVPASPESACYDPPLWNSLATGQPARVHRVVRLDARPSERRAPALWTLLRRNGGRAGLANFRNSWPPEPELAWVLTEPGIAAAAAQLFEVWPAGGRDARGAPADATRPPGLFEALDMLPARGPAPPSWRIVATDRVAMEAVLRLEVADSLRNPERRRSPYLVWVHLNSTDQAGHLMWHTIQRRPEDPIDGEALRAQAASWDGPRHLPGPTGYEPVAHRLLEVERWLAELLRLVSYDYVVVHSDHGMGRSRRASALPGHHVVKAVPESRYGIFALKGPGIAPGRRLEPISVLDVAPTLAYLLGLPIAEDLPGRVVAEAFSEAHRARHPPQSVPSW